jgi:DNA polymerase II large subunit
MDGKFLDVYNEVILDNFNAVLKQNFMFQTQIKFAEEKAKEVGELEKKLAALTSENSDANILREEIKTLNERISQKEAIIQSSSNTDNERHRLQTAVNNQMKEIEGLKKTIGDLQQQQKDQQNMLLN